MRAWEQECDLAKAKRRKTKWNKPKMGVLLKPVPRPKRSEILDPGGDNECGEKEVDAGDNESDDNDASSTDGDESDSGDSGPE
jgi:hypothetical protein